MNVLSVEYKYDDNMNVIEKEVVIGLVSESITADGSIEENVTERKFSDDSISVAKAQAEKEVENLTGQLELINVALEEFTGEIKHTKNGIEIDVENSEDSE